MSASVPARPPSGTGARLLVHLPFAAVLLLVALAGLRIAMYHWREGAVLIGGALLVAAVFRAALTTAQAGMLVIRGRVVDIASYAGLGLVILFLALTITGGPLR
ncbi:DUF3017 domain-containing protein [Saccharomonospora iraqiensis]|uniref:DUF3017 domain-containing protein n=1 Tax=Saccharomonospora iraqiensis TaxID=52698 RepID=UPI00022DECF7